MSNHVRFGLIAGLIGLAVNICASFLCGLLGPFVALIAGAAAGYFATQAERPPAQGDAARTGAIAGAIAGGLILIGQVIGGVLALTLLTSTGAQPFVGRLPQAGNMAEQSFFWGGGLVAGLCMGIVGVGLATGGGALAGYLAAPEESIPPTPSV